MGRGACESSRWEDYDVETGMVSSEFLKLWSGEYLTSSETLGVLRLTYLIAREQDFPLYDKNKELKLECGAEGLKLLKPKTRRMARPRGRISNFSGRSRGSLATNRVSGWVSSL